MVKRIRRTFFTLLVACAMAGIARGDDLAWKFDTSARTTDVKAVAAPAANGESWALQPGRSAPSSAIPLFSSCWKFIAESGGWRYAFTQGVYLLFR